VVIDGVSTSVTTQQDYASVLRAANGDLDVLISALKSKAN
jgi:ABC-type transporter MlaC component